MSGDATIQASSIWGNQRVQETSTMTAVPVVEMMTPGKKDFLSMCVPQHVNRITSFFLR